MRGLGYPHLSSWLHQLLFGTEGSGNLAVMLPDVAQGDLVQEYEGGYHVMGCLAEALPPWQFGEVVRFLGNHQNLTLTLPGVSIFFRFCNCQLLPFLLLTCFVTCRINCGFATGGYVAKTATSTSYSTASSELFMVRWGTFLLVATPPSASRRSGRMLLSLRAGGASFRHRPSLGLRPSRRTDIDG